MASRWRQAATALHGTTLTLACIETILISVTFPITWSLYPNHYGHYIGKEFRRTTGYTIDLWGSGAMGIYITVNVLAPLSIALSSLLLAYANLNKRAWMGRVDVQLWWLATATLVWLSTSICASIWLPALDCSSAYLFDLDGPWQSIATGCRLAQSLVAFSWILFAFYLLSFTFILSLSLLQPNKDGALWTSHVSELRKDAHGETLKAPEPLAGPYDKARMALYITTLLFAMIVTGLSPIVGVVVGEMVLFIVFIVGSAIAGLTWVWISILLGYSKPHSTHPMSSTVAHAGGMGGFTLIWLVLSILVLAFGGILYGDEGYESGWYKGGIVLFWILFGLCAATTALLVVPATKEMGWRRNVVFLGAPLERPRDIHVAETYLLEA